MSDDAAFEEWRLRQSQERDRERAQAEMRMHQQFQAMAALLREIVASHVEMPVPMVVRLIRLVDEIDKETP